MEEKTDWYPPEIKPVRVGVYQTLTKEAKWWGDVPEYNYWDGESFWRFFSTSKKAVYLVEAGLIAYPLYWRGLSREPK